MWGSKSFLFALFYLPSRDLIPIDEPGPCRGAVELLPEQERALHHCLRGGVEWSGGVVEWWSAVGCEEVEWSGVEWSGKVRGVCVCEREK
jgi:hypothetical protein